MQKTRCVAAPHGPLNCMIRKSLLVFYVGLIQTKLKCLKKNGLVTAVWHDADDFGRMLNTV